MAKKLTVSSAEIQSLRSRSLSPSKEGRQNLSQQTSEEASKATAAIKSTSEWEKWAKDVISTIANEQPPIDSQQMRRKISDLALAGVANESERVISSLRSQKELLLQGAADVVPSPLKAKGVALAAWSAIRLAQSAGKISSILSPNSSSIIVSNSPSKIKE